MCAKRSCGSASIRRALIARAAVAGPLFGLAVVCHPLSNNWSAGLTLAAQSQQDQSQQTQAQQAPSSQHQHQHDGAGHDHPKPERLGSVSFPISCAPASQEPFRRGVAMLHSFWYGEAEKTFLEITRTDPTCAMAWWGVAMTQYRPVWGPPTAEEFQKGRTAATRALAIETRTPRERDYVRAIATYFDSGELTQPAVQSTAAPGTQPASPQSSAQPQPPTQSQSQSSAQSQPPPAPAPAATAAKPVAAIQAHYARAAAYERAMEALHAAHPADNEGTIFYALALLGTASPADKTYAQQKKAGALLNEVLPKTPDHPGVAHYLIHSFDSPPLAYLALNAARTYAKIAPAAPHALHMPSHIFVRLGYWEEAISSNQASANAAHQHLQRTRPGATAFDELHALDYLVYAWLQRGEDDKAREVVGQLSSIRQLDLPNFAAGFAIAAIPGRYALERRAWAEAAAVPVRPEIFPWDTIPYAESSAWYARALGAARAGDPAAAKEAVSKLKAVQAKLVAAKDPYWPDQIEIQTRAAEAWIARAERRDEDALRLMRASADLESTTEKSPVTPGALLPSRELLGDLLLELGRADEALREYEASLSAAPKRLNSLYGAARAAQQTQQRDKATQYFRELVAGCDTTKGNRPAIAEAREFLASR